MSNRPNNYAFIDGINLHLTYEYLSWKIDYRKLRAYLSKRHNVNIAFWFLGRMPENEPIYRNLKAYGYQMKFREPSKKTVDEEGWPLLRQVYCARIN